MQLTDLVEEPGVGVDVEVLHGEERPSAGLPSVPHAPTAGDDAECSEEEEGDEPEGVVHGPAQRRVRDHVPAVEVPGAAPQQHQRQVHREVDGVLV